MCFVAKGFCAHHIPTHTAVSHSTVFTTGPWALVVSSLPQSGGGALRWAPCTADRQQFSHVRVQDEKTDGEAPCRQMLSVVVSCVPSFLAPKATWRRWRRWLLPGAPWVLRAFRLGGSVARLGKWPVLWVLYPGGVIAGGMLGKKPQTRIANLFSLDNFLTRQSTSIEPDSMIAFIDSLPEFQPSVSRKSQIKPIYCIVHWSPFQFVRIV